MLERLLRKFRPAKSQADIPIAPQQLAPAPPAETVVLPQQPPSPPAAPSDAPQAGFRDRDDAAWERYEERDTAGEYSWTYDGTTVKYGDASWEYHEPDTYRPKPVGERFYNELGSDHVDRLLSKWETATQKGRVREHLERAAQVAYMRRKQSDAARALADLLTRSASRLIRSAVGRCSLSGERNYW